MRSMRVERLDHLGIVAGICREIGLAEYLDSAGRTESAAGERGHGDGGHDPQRAGVQQSSAVSGLAVLRHQAGRAPAGAGDHGRDAARRLPGADAGLALRP